MIGTEEKGYVPAVMRNLRLGTTHAMAGPFLSDISPVSIVLVWRNGNIVGLPIFEEPSGRSGREKTKANEKNYCNHNSHSERTMSAPLVLAVLRPACDPDSTQEMTKNQT